MLINVNKISSSYYKITVASAAATQLQPSFGKEDLKFYVNKSNDTRKIVVRLRSSTFNKNFFLPKEGTLAKQERFSFLNTATG